MIDPHDPKRRRKLLKQVFDGNEALFAEYLGHFKAAVAEGSVIPHERAMIMFRRGWQKAGGRWVKK